MLSEVEASRTVAAMAALSAKGDSAGAGMLMASTVADSDNRPHDLAMLVSMSVGLTVYIAHECGLEVEFFDELVATSRNLD